MVLLKKASSPKLYNQILGLEDNLEKRGECAVMNRNREEVVPVMRYLYRVKHRDSKNFQLTLI